MSPGTYRGEAEGLEFDFRIESAVDEHPAVVSGDISRDGGSDFVASFVCEEPRESEDGRTITGDIVFRGNPELYTGSISLTADPRGIGTFHVAVDMEGGYRDVFAGQLDWQGSFLRRLAIEVDGIQGTKPPEGYTGRDGRVMTLEEVFLRVGLDVNIVVDSFRGRGAAANRARGYSLAEIHAAMTRRRSQVPAGGLHTHVFVCSYLSGRGNRGVLGVMYDFERNDLNRRPREGVAAFYDHPMLSDPRVPEELRNREYVFTLVHEIGHALNLLHSFDKARPAALSWMNYPHLYPRGYEAGQDHDGTDEFWRQFGARFDEEELRHLRHATPREIRAGGFPFGTYEEGTSSPFGGPATPRRTRLGANPLRATRGLELRVGSVQRGYYLGEPVFLSIGVKNVGTEAVHVPDALDPTEGYVRLHIRTPAGDVMEYRPPVRMCKQAQLVHLPAGESMPRFDGVPLFLSSDGPMFTEPGIYLVAAELTGVDGSRSAISPAAPIRVLTPDTETEAFAYQLWGRAGALEAMYLRHPLVARDEWNALEEDLVKAGLAADNTTESFFHYVSALGWMTPFADPSTTTEKNADRRKAAERIKKVKPQGLPSSVRTRKDEMAKSRPTGAEPKAARARARPGRAIMLRREERARAEVPPSGLFGALGLQPFEEARKRPRGPVDPFERVVSVLEGTRAFADIVSWNIEHLHAPANWDRIPKVAELMRSFRCDFWGLQEVDARSLAQLVETMNSSGRTRYTFVATKEAGQQCGAVFRTDTTTVEVLDVPEDLFDDEIDVELADSSGGVAKREVFYRQPFLCQVHVQQAEGAVFDFRCAVVHLKSTDTTLKDTGNSLREAAAKALATWLEADGEGDGERDYLILGDMNAETAEQGLRSFSESEGLELLSVGMQDKYGNAEALTRVASQRLLDHIVVTDEASASIPGEDKAEQIIIRSDTRIAEWTSAFSDHVPVAVRFVFGEDVD